MPVIRVDRVDDPRLAEYRSVSDGELLRRRHRFVAEGRLVVGRLLESGHRVESLLVNEASFRALDALLSRVPPHIPVYVCETDEFAAITGFNLHRGCLALAERPAARAFEEVVRATDLLLVLEAVTDADNVGSAFRNAAAFGASVVLSEACCDPLYRKAIRTSMGAALVMPFGRVASMPDVLDELREAGFATVALTPSASAQPLPDVVEAAASRPVAMLLGHEGEGVTELSLEACEYHARIPISSDVDSLNVATASAVALYEFNADSL